MNQHESMGGVARATRWITLTMALLGWLEPAAGAAQSRVGLEAQAGLTVPTGRLGGLTDPGASFGFLAAYHVSPRVALNLDGNVDLLGGASGATATAPDMRIWRYGGGLSADLLPARRWALVGSVGAGAARFSSDRFVPDGETADRSFAHTYFTSNAGLKLGYSLSERVTTYVGARGVWIRADEDDTGVLAEIDPARFEPFGSTWSIPVTAGFQVGLGGGRRAQVAESRPASRSSAAPDDREQRETAARRLCEEAEAAIAAGDPDRARELLHRARDEYAGTLCANSVDAQLDRIAAIETIRERIHFEFDRSRITDEAASVLQRKAEVLRRHSEVRLTLEGHCDDRGSLEYNQTLGMRRAQAARDYLVTLGIAAETFQLVSYGEERPLSGEQSEWAWGRNRRSEFVIQNLGSMRGR